MMGSETEMALLRSTKPPAEVSLSFTRQRISAEMRTAILIEDLNVALILRVMEID